MDKKRKMRIGKRIKDYIEQSLRRQLVFWLLAGVLFPLSLVISILFGQTRQEMRKQKVSEIHRRMQETADEVDRLLDSVGAVSDMFAYDEELGGYLKKEYDKVSLEKRKDIYELINYFNITDPFSKQARLSAIYCPNGQVLNFLDPMWDGAEVAERMKEIGAEKKENLSILKWYPLEDNFLRQEPDGNARLGKVVTGMRRIINFSSGNWICTQFFLLPEQNFYDIYRESALELKGMVYILDGNGGLISSSEREAVQKGNVPQSVLELAGQAEEKYFRSRYQGKEYFVECIGLQNADWQMISIVPADSATEYVDRLFRRMVIVMILCMIGCIALITWISHRFLQPVEVLDASMREVYKGNLEAYVNPDAYHGEIKSMMIYYNDMLMQNVRYINDIVEAEEKKKQLELEVLMGQINPHFLYNTLENIVWKSNEAGMPDIGRLAASLGRLYRLSIGNGETITGIRQELEHVTAYVSIQKSRYKERVNFELDADSERLREYSMIKLTLQPVVENCFMYAMENINHPLKIRLSVRILKDTIRFQVGDNGSGLTRRQLEGVRRQIEEGHVREEAPKGQKRRGTGIGLYSVRERIAIYTGQNDSVRIRSKSGVGTIVTITIPKQKQKDKNCQ
mgnify:CR=1 FL=1